MQCCPTEETPAAPEGAAGVICSYVQVIVAFADFCGELESMALTENTPAPGGVMLKMFALVVGVTTAAGVANTL